MATSKRPQTDLALNNLVVEDHLVAGNLTVRGRLVANIAEESPLPISRGGTGSSEFNNNGTLFFDGLSNRIESTQPGVSGQVLTSNGSLNPPSFQNVPPQPVPLPISLGGTGTTSFSNQTGDGVTFFDPANNRLSSVAAGTVGDVLSSQGPGLPPVYATPSTGVEFKGPPAPVANAVPTFVGTADGDIQQQSNTSLAKFNGPVTARGSSTSDTSVYIGANWTSGTNPAGGTAPPTGNDNVGIGVGSQGMSTTGARNTSIGFGSLAAVTSTNDNTAVGYQALFNEKSSSFNVAVGSGALLTSNSVTGQNVAIGSASLGSSTTGGRNTAVGHGASSDLTTGKDNTTMGHSAGASITSGSANTCVGHGADVGSGTTQGCVVLGNGATTTEDFQFVVNVPQAGGGRFLSSTFETATTAGNTGTHTIPTNALGFWRLTIRSNAGTQDIAIPYFPQV